MELKDFIKKFGKENSEIREMKEGSNQSRKCSYCGEGQDSGATVINERSKKTMICETATGQR